MSVAAVEAPSGGIWRVGRSPDPLAFGEPLEARLLNSPTSGNRFDSALANYRVCYFGSSLTVCYGETLARFRPDPALAKVADEEGFMALGEVPRDWRQRRIAVLAALNRSQPRPSHLFLDVEALETRELLRIELADVLAYYGYGDLDVALVRGSDRRITRMISQWAHDQSAADGSPAYAGVRYLSRLNTDWECWAVFQGVGIEERVRQSIRREDEGLQRVAATYRLTVY